MSARYRESSSAGAASGLPLSVNSGDWSFDIDGRARVNGRRPGAADWFVVTPGYFESLGIPLRRGRLPAASDSSTAPAVVFINDETARAVFPNADPIGQRIRLAQATGSEQPWRTIAGVVADVRHRGLETPPRTEIYMPVRAVSPFLSGRAGTRHERRDQDPAGSRGIRRFSPGCRPRARPRRARRQPAGHVHDRCGLGVRPSAERHADRRVRRPGADADRRRPLRANGVRRDAAAPRDRCPHRDGRDPLLGALARRRPGRTGSSGWELRLGLPCRS